jgi:tetratricopeptide (TPR) repeat protein
MRIALDSRDWETLAKAATARAIIYEHEPDVAAGRQQGCVAPPTVRLDYYKNAAKAYIALGEIETAQKWLDRGIKALAAKTPTEWITFAELELECGKPDRAAQYADLADKLWWADDYDAYWYPEHSEALWEKLGQPERAKSILAKSEEMKNMRLQQEKQSEKSVLYGTSR